MYEKSILITQDRRLEQLIKQLMRKKKLEIETDLPLLSKLDAVRNDILWNKNTINLRGEFGQFIKDHGFPFCVIIDYQINFGLSSKDDPDQRKILRTFLLAFTLLAHGKGFENASANIVLIVPINLKATVSQYIGHPSALLEQVRTKDERVNAIIDSFAADEEKVKNFFKLFNIFRPDDGRYVQEMEKLETIIQSLLSTARLEQQIQKEEKPATEMIQEELEPAHIVCRATSEKLMRNGELVDATEEEKSHYLEKNIHMDGAVTTKTLLAVKERLLATFRMMEKVSPFKKDEKIFITVPDSSIIDGSFAGGIGTFLSKSLSEYTGISLNMGKTNCEKAKNSPGYIAIKDYIIKNL